jgi:tetratricopeptide (TPR) repeat protein/predicted Ser/Thr protein kinase
MVGTRVSHYRLTGRLGEGGMGVVYEAIDEVLGRSVALKFPSRDTTSVHQLAGEARAASRLNHPNVAQIYEFGETGEGDAFIAMELVRGRTLSQMLADGPLSPEETLRIVTAVAEALEEAHAQGIMHLDIKPGNIAVNDRGVVKVLDFGLSRSLRAEHIEPGDDPRTQTLTTEVRGTPSYMSPEQARGLTLDVRSDLFSLGAVMYECLTGRRAFPGVNAVSALLEVVSLDPPPPSTIARRVPRRFDAIVGRLLAKDRNARYASAGELLADLRIGRQTRRRRRVGAIPAVALVLVLATAGWLVPWRQLIGGRSGVRQVVVLPFENRGGQPEQAAFCDGLAEVVGAMLSRPGFADGLWVVPATDVRRFGVRTVAAAGRTFHADLAISGSAQRTSNPAGWAITLDASDAERPHLLGSRTIRLDDREAGDLERRLGVALADLLDVKARGAAPNAQPSPAAYSQFVEGRGYLRQADRGDNLKHAISDLEAVTAAAPDYAPAEVALAEGYFRLYTNTRQEEWLAKADQAVRRASDINENEPGVHLMLGRILRATGQLEAAIRELHAALTRDPGDVAALLQLAGAYESQKRLPQAEATYQQAIRLRPSYFPAYTNLGIFYWNQGKYEQAREPLTLVTKLAPDYADGFTNLAALEYKLDHLEEARRLFTRSIQLKPTAAGYANRCGVEFYLKAMHAAVADCRKAVELQPDDALGWGNLGDALAEQGSAADAMKAYRQAIEVGQKLLAINPTNAELSARVAKFAAKTGQKALAIDLAEKAVSQGTGVSMLYNAGKAFGLAGECGRSTGLLNQALDQGYPRQEAGRDPDLARLRSLGCKAPNP